MLLRTHQWFLSHGQGLRRLFCMDTLNAMQPGFADTGHDNGCDRVWVEFQAALQHVPLLPRLAFLLSDVLGKPIDEVAHLLGRDIATCRQLIGDARTRLRALHVGGHGDHP